MELFHRGNSADTHAPFHGNRDKADPCRKFFGQLRIIVAYNSDFPIRMLRKILNHRQHKGPHGHGYGGDKTDFFHLSLLAGTPA